MQNVDYSGCNNGSGQTTFPQATVYDSMVLHNKSISFYINYTEVTESEGKNSSSLLLFAVKKQSPNRTICLDRLGTHAKKPP